MWYHGTEYQCQLCNVDPLYTSRRLLQHLRDVHGKSADVYKKEFGQLSTKWMEYKCRICEEFVNHDEEVIAR